MCISLFNLSLKVFLREFDEILGVCSDYLLAEVFQNLGQLSWHLNLVSRENPHLTHVCHLSLLN